MRWRDFEAAAPEIATTMRERMDSDRVVLVGTVRSDGAARISPVNPYLVGGELLLGMMSKSHKVADLERDPRCVVQSATTDSTGHEGEVKLNGRVVPMTDPDRRDEYGDAVEAEFGFRPEEPFPLWAVDIDRGWWIRYVGDEQQVERFP